MSSNSLTSNCLPRQCVAMCYSALQCVAVCCSVSCNSVFEALASPRLRTLLRLLFCQGSVLQSVAGHCSVFHYVTMCCSVLQCVESRASSRVRTLCRPIAFQGSVLQCVAACCSVCADFESMQKLTLHMKS